jgi:hypothetical protein
MLVSRSELFRTCGLVATISAVPFELDALARSRAVRRASAARGISPLFAQYDANFSSRAAATIRRSEPITVAGASP